MQVYVQSRGIAQEDDYRWLKLEANQQVIATPNFLNQAIAPGYPSLVSVIDSHKFSLVLTRQQQQLVLLVTGLEANQGESDFMGRKIRNSVVWLASSEESAQIRRITVEALQGKLAETVESAIDRSNDWESGFRVDWDKFKVLGEDTALEYYDNSNPKRQLAPNSEVTRQEIALEIQTNDFPAEYPILIIVTTIKSASDLEKMPLWRGLSNRVTSSQLLPVKSSTSPQVQKKTLLTTAIVATTILVLTIFLIL